MQDQSENQQEDKCIEEDCSNTTYFTSEKNFHQFEPKYTVTNLNELKAIPVPKEFVGVPIAMFMRDENGVDNFLGVFLRGSRFYYALEEQFMKMGMEIARQLKRLPMVKGFVPNTPGNYSFVPVKQLKAEAVIYDLIVYTRERVRHMYGADLDRLIKYLNYLIKNTELKDEWKGYEAYSKYRTLMTKPGSDLYCDSGITYV